MPLDQASTESMVFARSAGEAFMAGDAGPFEVAGISNGGRGDSGGSDGPGTGGALRGGTLIGGALMEGVEIVGKGNGGADTGGVDGAGVVAFMGDTVEETIGLGINV